MKKPTFWWCDERNGLVLDTPMGLNALQMSSACAFAAKVYKQRYESLPPGDRKDTVLKGLTALRDGNVVQRVVGRTDYEVDRILLGAR